MGLVVQRLTAARIGEGVTVSWNTAKTAVLAEGQRTLIADPACFDGVRVVGVDEHVWRHTRHGNKICHRRLGPHPDQGPDRLVAAGRCRIVCVSG